MPKLNVLVVCPPDIPALKSLDQIRDVAEVTIGNDRGTVEGAAADAEVVVYAPLVGKVFPFPEVWSRARQVKWVHSLSAGVDKLLFPELIASPVPVTNARGVFSRPLADFAVLGMLYFYKRVRRLIENQRAHRWDDFTVEALPGKVMGVVGYGDIGRECAALAKPMGVKIYAVRRKPELSADDPAVDRVFGPDQLREMLGEIDVLLAAAPLTPETRHMIGEPEFRAMKTSAIIINVGRGPVIDEAALIQALQGKWVAGAALDVFESEPLRPDHPFWDMENVLISPHCTDRTTNPDWLQMSVDLFLENFRRYRAGEPLLNLVDKKAGY